jgi:hypothetical protein
MLLLKEPEPMGRHIMTCHVLLWLTLKNEGALPDRVDSAATPVPSVPLQFPEWKPRTESSHRILSAKELYKLFSSIHKPSDVTGAHLDALNLRLFQDQSLENVVPGPLQDGTRFLPDLDWGTNSEEKTGSVGASGRSIMLCGGRKAPDSAVFQSRKAELLLDLDTAFRAVQRLPARPGEKAVRPGHFFKFWQTLLLMSKYWDISGGAETPSKDPGSDNVSASPTEGEDSALGGRYGTGKDMPEQFREDTVRALVETVSWLFGCQFS